MAGPEDRETTVTFTDADETMQIVTANRKLKGRLKKLGFEPEDTEDGHDFYEVPIAFLQLRKPRELDMTDEEKEERRERLREARKAAGIGEFRKGAGKKAKSSSTKGKGKAKAAPEPEEDDEDEVELTEMSISELRAYAKSQGVSGAGTKKDIIARIEGEEEEDEDEDDEEETEVVRPRGRKSKSGSSRKK